MTIIEKLMHIQQELKAPKTQRNNFGKYNYRNQEDILEAVKPLLKKYETTMFITDETVETQVGIFYANARVVFIDGPDSSIETKAQAFVDMNAKGMSAGQASGAASSYARKYALNGLFLIDDTKDSDATNDHDKSTTPQSSSKPELKPDTAAFNKAKEFVSKGGQVSTIEAKYKLAESTKQLLLS